MSPTRLILAVVALAASGAPARAAAAEAPVGASSCTGCHAVHKGVDTAVPPIAGRKAAEIVALMQAFSAEQRPATVMGRIAKGYAATEVDAIAAWFAQQR